MLVRVAQASDIAELDALFKGTSGVEYKRDRIIVTGDPISACLAWRPTALVHELRVSGLSGRSTVRALVNFAVGDALARFWPIAGAAFVVASSSEPMLQLAREVGGDDQGDKRLYLLRL